MFLTQKPSLIVAAAAAFLIGLLPGCSNEPNKPDNGFVIAVERSGGMVASKDPFMAYRFTMAGDGSWEFKSRMTGEPRRGKVAAGDVDKWLKEIAEGGFDKLKSNPKLGQTDQPFMDITLKAGGGRERKRIPQAEQLSKAINKKVAELVEPGK